MKKKLSIIFIAAALLLTACSNSGNGENDNNTDSQSETTTAAVQENISDENAFTGFKPGIWKAEGAGEYTYYIFNDDMKSGKRKQYAQEEGTAFTYEIKEDETAFYYGEDKSYAPAIITVNSENSITVQQKEGIQLNFEFVSSESEESFEFPNFTFQTGIWKSDNEYYFFNDDSTSGYTQSFEDGTGLSFTYEIDQNNAMFHMGAVDSDSPAEFVINSNNSVTLKWSDGTSETLTFTGHVTEDGFNYLENSASDFAPFRAGVWVNSEQSFGYEFREDQSGAKIDLGTEAGSPFQYEISGNTVSFKFGDAEAEPISATASEIDENTVLLDWEDGTSETLTFTYDGDFDGYLESIQG